jgi:DNA-binding NtrC family response regulator
MGNKESVEKGGGEFIVLVDDEEPIRETLAEFLKLSGYQVKAFSSPSEFLSFLNQGALKNIDLLLTDFSMPGDITGLELAKKIMVRFPETSIVCMSGSFDPVSDQTFPPGIHFLAKPFSPPKLLGTLNHVFGLKRAAAQSHKGFS